MNRQRLVGVVGPGAPSGSGAGELLQAAETVGTQIARRGGVVVCGGLGGAMEAACRGARAAGGLTVGILPGADRSAANPHVVVPVATGLGELRNGLVVRASDVLVAVGGEYGTLSELAFAVKVGKPVVALRSWGLVDPRGEVAEPWATAATAEEAVGLAWELAGRGTA